MKRFLVLLILIIFVGTLIALPEFQTKYADSFLPHGLHPSQERRIFSALIMQSVVSTNKGWTAESQAEYAVKRADVLIAELNKVKQ